MREKLLAVKENSKVHLCFISGCVQNPKRRNCVFGQFDTSGIITMAVGSKSVMAVLRWLLVLPAAVGGYIAGLIIVALLFLFSCVYIPSEASAITINDLSWRTVLFGFIAGNTPWILKILTNAGASYLFVWGGSSVAPYRKTSTAIALTVLLLIFIIPLDLFVVHSYSIGIRLLDIGATMAVCALACRTQFKKVEKAKQKVETAYGTQSPNCHSLTLPHARFCGNCGAPL